MEKEVQNEEPVFEGNEILVNLQWEIDRKTAHIRSFENRLLAALSINSVIVGILVTFYSLNPVIENYEKGIFITFGVLFLLMLGIQLYLWWPKKASERESMIKIEKRINIKDLNKQLNTLDTSLHCRARLVYAGLVSFAVQIIFLLVIILCRII